MDDGGAAYYEQLKREEVSKTLTNCISLLLEMEREIAYGDIIKEYRIESIRVKLESINN